MSEAPLSTEQIPKPPHDLALPKITIQMLGDYGQEGFFEKTDKPVEGVAGVNWSQAAVDFACEIVRPAVWNEIERLRRIETAAKRLLSLVEAKGALLSDPENQALIQAGDTIAVNEGNLWALQMEINS